MEEQIIKCSNCEHDYMHITNVYNTINSEATYPPKCCGYKQGAVVVELTCESCEHKQYIVIGEHKGQIYFSQKEEAELK